MLAVKPCAASIRVTPCANTRATRRPPHKLPIPMANVVSAMATNQLWFDARPVPTMSKMRNAAIFGTSLSPRAKLVAPALSQCSVRNSCRCPGRASSRESAQRNGSSRHSYSVQQPGRQAGSRFATQRDVWSSAQQSSIAISGPSSSGAMALLAISFRLRAGPPDRWRSVPPQQCLRAARGLWRPANRSEWRNQSSRKRPARRP